MQAMFEVNVKTISELKAFLIGCASQSKLLERMRNSDQAFTRNRKLSFCRLVLFICKLSKKTLSVELDQFFTHDLQEPETCSVTAFCRQRKKLSHWFFCFWNDVLCASFYHYGKTAGVVKTWRGHRLIAVDGSKVSLIATKAIKSVFGGQSNRQSSYCGAQAIVQFDVLNDLFIYSRLAPYRTAELELAWQAIDNLSPDMIAIYDRNFSNYKTIALHLYEEQPCGFVIRAKESHNNIKAFLATGLTSQLVQIPPTASAIEGMRKAGFIMKVAPALTVRLVRVELDNGITEVLITNLWESDGYESEVFKELYGMRWGIETGIGMAKNILQLESMSGLSVESVYQDFYATIFMTNLVSLLGRQGTETVQLQRRQSRRRYKWRVQVNMNKASGKLRQMITGLFLSADASPTIQLLIRHFCKHVSPIRPGRKYLRRRINKQFNCKHRTYSNYKPAT
jgi:hypothetical protein